MACSYAKLEMNRSLLQKLARVLNYLVETDSLGATIERANNNPFERGTVLTSPIGSGRKSKDHWWFDVVKVPITRPPVEPLRISGTKSESCGIDSILWPIIRIAQNVPGQERHRSLAAMALSTLRSTNLIARENSVKSLISFALNSFSSES